MNPRLLLPLRKSGFFAGLGLYALLSAAQADCPSSPSRFVANSAEVTDTRTGLIWQRCSAGQTWSGSACTGTASPMMHEAALIYARNNAGAQNWRLPDVKELASLADKGCSAPAIDIAAFPATPNSFYWSSSPFVANSSNAWVVSFGNGVVRGSGFRFAEGHAVRLVRASQ